MITSISGISSRTKKNYLLNSEELNNINSGNNEGNKPEVTEAVSETTDKQEKREDIYAKMPIRLLGYTNELGEAIRPISPMLANLSWLPAIGYISADIADKYRQDEYSNQNKSKGRASKQLVTQLLSSVFLPTVAVKAGQSLVNGGAIFTKKGLSINTREKISNVVINSMKSGEHKNYLNEAGHVDKEAYKNALSGKFDEILKHKKTHKKIIKPIISILDFITKPITKKTTTDKVKTYAETIVDRMIDERQQLLDGIKPDNMSKYSFKKYLKKTKDSSIAEKQSLAFDAVRKLEKGRMFNNRVLKSIGGLAALSLMAKPIDKFVEHYVISKFVSPQIDNISEIYYKQREARKNKKA